MSIINYYINNIEINKMNYCENQYNLFIIFRSMNREKNTNNYSENKKNILIYLLIYYTIHSCITFKIKTRNYGQLE